MRVANIGYGELLDFTSSILRAVGADDFTCQTVAYGLCISSLRGVDSHGVRLLPHYIRSAESGRKNPRPQFKLNTTYPALIELDADNAFGLAAGMKAVAVGAEVAAKTGVSVVAVTHSSHPGAMAPMALTGADAGMMTFAFTHADSLLLSTHGVRPYFGTNPICFAVPGKNKNHYCLDMSVTKIPWNRLLLKRKEGERLDDEVAADSSGHVTQDPNLAASLLPIGDYKGFGLASMVEVLCGIYTNMRFGREIPAMYTSDMSEPRGLGQFYIFIRSDGIVSEEAFKDRIERMSVEVRSEPRKNECEEIMMPNDKETKESQRRLALGIPLTNDIYSELVSLSKRFGVSISKH